MSIVLFCSIQHRTVYFKQVQTCFRRSLLFYHNYKQYAIFNLSLNNDTVNDYHNRTYRNDYNNRTYGNDFHNRSNPSVSWTFPDTSMSATEQCCRTTEHIQLDNCILHGLHKILNHYTEQAGAKLN